MGLDLQHNYMDSYSRIAEGKVASERESMLNPCRWKWNLSVLIFLSCNGTLCLTTASLPESSNPKGHDLGALID